MGEAEEKAMKIIKKAMEKDLEYARGWHANIACVLQDLCISHKIANKAATRFMKLAFGINIK